MAFIWMLPFGRNTGAAAPSERAGSPAAVACVAVSAAIAGRKILETDGCSPVPWRGRAPGPGKNQLGGQAAEDPRRKDHAAAAEGAGVGAADRRVSQRQKARLLRQSMLHTVGDADAAVFEDFRIQKLQIDLVFHGEKKRNSRAEQERMDAQADLVDEAGLQE